jgi:hypothetical protein
MSSFVRRAFDKWRESWTKRLIPVESSREEEAEGVESEITETEEEIIGELTSWEDIELTSWEDIEEEDNPLRWLEELLIEPEKKFCAEVNEQTDFDRCKDPGPMIALYAESERVFPRPHFAAYLVKPYGKYVIECSRGRQTEHHCLLQLLTDGSFDFDQMQLSYYGKKSLRASSDNGSKSGAGVRKLLLRAIVSRNEVTGEWKIDD